MISFSEPIEFLWDTGNEEKNWISHRVSNKESEEAFLDGKKQTYQDVHHSSKEERHVILGRTEQGRILFIAFTLRKNKVRIISARDADKRERSMYEKTIDRPCI